MQNNTYRKIFILLALILIANLTLTHLIKPSKDNSHFLANKEKLENLLSSPSSIETQEKLFNKDLIEPSGKNTVIMLLINSMFLLAFMALLSGLLLNIKFLRKYFRKKKNTLISINKYSIKSPSLSKTITFSNFFKYSILLLIYYCLFKILNLLVLSLPNYKIYFSLLLNTFFEIICILVLINYIWPKAFRQLKKALKKIPLIIKVYITIIPLVVIGFIMQNLLLKILGITPQSMPIINLIMEDESTLDIILIGLQAIFLAPIAEELIFRGLIFGVLRKYCSFSFSGLVSALLFAILHESLSSFLPIFILGVCFSYYYEKTKNLSFPILLHSLHNTIAFILIILLKY